MPGRYLSTRDKEKFCGSARKRNSEERCIHGTRREAGTSGRIAQIDVHGARRAAVQSGRITPRDCNGESKAHNDQTELTIL
ncbi:unnamed protein product, partial [Mesorhabditis belari]|uniref:Uncharacterized protein n=1 Tax=Mesorhabditis belari TaxID=2138241 RepID=A0AAF3J8P8_9BILA